MDILAFLTQNGISLITLAIVLATVLRPTLQKLFQSKVEQAEKRSTWELEMEQRLLDRVLTNGPRANNLVDRMILLQSAHTAATQERAKETEKVVSTAIGVMQDYAAVASSTVKQMERHEALMQEMLIAMNRISQRLA